MRTPHRILLAASLALALGPHASVLAGWFEPDVLEIEVGSSSTSTLEVKQSRRLTVSTYNLPPKTTEWVSVEKDGTRHVTERLVQNPIANTYSTRIEYSGSTDIWKITDEDAGAPVNVVLRVRGMGFVPRVSVFMDVESPGKLNPEKGFSVPQSDFAENEVIAIMTFDPNKKTFVTVQSDEPTHADYRISVIRAGKYRQ